MSRTRLDLDCRPSILSLLDDEDPSFSIKIRLLDGRIQSILINRSNDSVQHNYSSLCAVISQACVIDGNYLTSNKFLQDFSRLPYITKGIYVDSMTGANGFASFIFGKSYQRMNVSSADADYDDGETQPSMPMPEALLEEIVSYVPVFRLRYALNASTVEKNQLSVQWERQVLRYLNEEFQSNVIHISASTSTAISDVVTKQARDEAGYLGILFAVFILLVCVSISVQGNSHTSVGYLSLCGIVSLTLSSGATFGVLTVVGIEIIEPMALVVFIIASRLPCYE